MNAEKYCSGSLKIRIINFDSGSLKDVLHDFYAFFILKLRKEQKMSQKLNNFDMVIFGATGDLAMRKLLPCLYQAHAAGLLHPKGRILGVSRSQMDTAQFLAKVQSDSKIHVKKILLMHCGKVLFNVLNM